MFTRYFRDASPWPWCVITVCTVVQNCCNGDEPCQWNTPIFRPSGIENPWTDRHQIWQGWLCRGHHPTCRFLSLRGELYICMKLSSSVSIFVHPHYFFISCAPVEIAPFDRFSCFISQKMCFCDSYVLFGVRTKKFNNFNYFSQKTRNSLFPQCKTSNGNNSGSIKDRVAKFAYSMGFSAIADRTVWPPSLSRDRNWPRPLIRHKTTLWVCVTPVAYKIEQLVMGQKMCFSDIYVLFGGEQNFLIISTIFRKKREIPYSRNVKNFSRQ